MLAAVDFIAYHDLQAQTGLSVFEELSTSFACRWRIGPNQLPSAAEIAVMLDHSGYHPGVKKGRGGYRHLFHLSHDLGDVGIYRRERENLKDYDIVFVPSALHYRQAVEQLAGTTVVMETGWAKYDQIPLVREKGSLIDLLDHLPYEHTLLYAPGLAWTREWEYLLPLFGSLPWNIIVKNHIYVNNEQRLPPGQESEYVRHLESADSMEKAVLAAAAPNMVVAPRGINICGLFPSVDVLISDQSSVLLEFVPFGLSLETGRYNDNESAYAPESSHLSEHVRFLDKAQICDVLSSPQSFEGFVLAEKSRRAGLPRDYQENTNLSTGKLTALIVQRYLGELEKCTAAHNGSVVGRFMARAVGPSNRDKQRIETVLRALRASWLAEKSSVWGCARCTPPT